MLHSTPLSCASLRYRRPYWMLFLKGVDNWKIYTVIQQPEHQRTEMLYQAWLGGLDRPYTRPKCMANQPLWLSKKRHLLRKERLDGPETPLERYVLEWHRKFHSFQGTERPSVDDLHVALDLVERPLDLSYALQLLSQCRNLNNIRFAKDTFLIFLEACLRVGRRDCAEYGLQHAHALGFWHIEDDHRRYLSGEQSWYKLSVSDNLYYPLDENAELNENRVPPPRPDGVCADAVPSIDAGVTCADVGSAERADTGASVEDEIARLEAELAALENESLDDKDR
ncbi:hypothetical protein ERJ75_001013300 [Trypanosoma vivax]|uniref:Uncharacterized protein n=1 Tax=Trypanosoma vivax (strain Y486) TaxID=1055687 RepID=G0U262_TRYVY|nr:hypothetical protein TRVL_03998 [Trypanosoma vivax]KAH8611573.1 hypothetical protein ERJ75_001013300 [Trypanosoma vivax]CCC50365.1 conserved hypothetical protein [Trypanosoma vivax Y486]